MVEEVARHQPTPEGLRGIDIVVESYEKIDAVMWGKTCYLVSLLLQMKESSPRLCKAGF